MAVEGWWDVKELVLEELSPIEWGVLGAYLSCLVLLAAYGTHRWFLLHVLARARRRPGARNAELPESPPIVTVQIPIYNEMHVARRVIDAVAALRYPAGRLEIQVLDDSTDATTEIVATAVGHHARRGANITHVRRPGRDGFKAGALANGLRTARGELVAIFDADFVPQPDFLERVVPHFSQSSSGGDVGMVQARWGHLNRDHSTLTRAQALLLDGHFLIEHRARNAAGRFFNFNGTAGMWRRACIDDAGGWCGDTLTEDLDLSYRAQLRGWRFVFLPDVVVPAELPVEMAAFKTQQYRWAKGSIQTAFKILPAVLRSDQPVGVKVEAFCHLTANLAYPVLLCLAVLVGPAVCVRATTSPWLVAAIDLPLFIMTMASVGLFYLVALRQAGVGWHAAWKELPVIMAVGIGLSVNNTRAVVSALLGRKTPFARTPKYNLEEGRTLAACRYRGGTSRTTWVELLLGLGASAALVFAAVRGSWGGMPFLGLFVAGFFYVALGSASRRSRGPMAS